ncbi:MAG: LysR substrate-binding domain-containing protein [Burkholderiales bacterium]|jgi:DNA-binding transcriptional LysR family regulator|nr:LysR substrate-binding domain-containing protein [Burkholderiales bacterium]
MRHVTLRQLRVFEAVARHRSFSRAADELHLTQPAVSMQVKSLEEQAGVPLFEQIGKKIFLTEAGEELYARAHAVARELDAAEEALDAMRGLEHGRLTIGIVSTGKYFAPQLLGRFLKSHPGVTLKLSVNNREVMLRELAGNEVDLAITGRPPEDLDVVAVPFARHPHVMVAATDHPLARTKRVPLARIAEEPFLMREQGSGTRGLLERLFAEHGLPLRVGMEMPSNETIKQAAMAGMGVSFLSLHTIALELETRRLAVLDVAGLPIVRDWYVVHLGGKRLSPLAEALKRFLVEEAAKHLCGQEVPRKRRPSAQGERL